MRRLARFVIRPAGDGLRGDLILGVLMSEQSAGLLGAGWVYEIRETLGELMIEPVGEAALGPSRATSMLDVCWMNSVDDILERGRGRFILTRQEVAESRARSITGS